MFEAESGSIARFLLECLPDYVPYYNLIPMGFARPCVFFPVPEVLSFGSTLSGYELEYAWYIKVFGGTGDKYSNGGGNAYKDAVRVLDAIRQRHNSIPLVDENGVRGERGFKIKDPRLKCTDDGVAVLTVKWSSFRNYDNCSGPESRKTNTIFL